MSDFYQLKASDQADRLTRLAETALSYWGVSGCQPRLIKFRENAVFEVRDRSGRPAALRVHRQGYHSNESLQSELRWMAMLQEAGMQVPSPVALAADPKTFLASVGTDYTPGVWQVDMLSWMPGRELGEVGVALDLSTVNTAELFGRLGESMATLHNLSIDWPGAVGMQRQAWDHDGLVGEAPLWGQFWQLEALDADQRKLILAIRSAVSRDLIRYADSTENYGLIHADLVPENVMIHDDQIQLIDFDDAGFGWHMFEIATALHWLTEEPGFDLMQTSLLAGYQRLRPLSQTDLNALPLFHVARSLTYLGWVHTRSQTRTAIELTPLMIEIASDLGEAYLQNHNA